MVHPGCSSGVTMSIATWNMSHAVKRDAARRAAAWAHLRNLGLDVGLVQEAGLPVPGDLEATSATAPAKPDCGTAVVSFAGRVEPLEQPIRPTWNRNAEFRIPDAARPGTLAVALIQTTDKVPIVAVSLYGMLRYADQSILRAASDLLPIFDTTLRTRVVVGGDFNLHTQSNEPGERARARPIFDLLEAFGLRDAIRVAHRGGLLVQGAQSVLLPCPCAETDCTHVRTHRHPQHRPGTMANNDYFFATVDLIDRLQGVEVHNGDADAAWTHSDHAPVVATFDLS